MGCTSRGPGFKSRYPLKWKEGKKEGREWGTKIKMEWGKEGGSGGGGLRKEGRREGVGRVVEGGRKEGLLASLMPSYSD